MTDMSLLLEPIFLLYALSNLLTSIAFNSPLVFLPSHAVNLGCTDQQAAQIVSAFGELYHFSGTAYFLELYLIILQIILSAFIFFSKFPRYD